MTAGTISIEQVDHIGIRVSDPGRALAFYRALGFELEREVEFDAVIIIATRWASRSTSSSTPTTTMAGATC